MTMTIHEGRPFCTSPTDVLQEHGVRLSPLLGKRLEAAWVAWDVAADELFVDEPVVLRIGDTNLELLHTQLSMLWIGYDSLDLQSPPAWHSCWAGEFDLTWRRNGHPALMAAIGRSVLMILLIEYRTRFVSAEAPDAPPREAWVLSGIGFDLDDGKYLEVRNGLDENELVSLRPEGEDFRITLIAQRAARP